MPNGYGLGRKPEFDDRSRDYPIRRLLTRNQLAVLKGRAWGTPIWLDQGDSSACTGFSAAYDLAATPVRVVKSDGTPLNDSFAMAVYHLAQHYDEWAGESYDGSSVLGATKAVNKLGYVGFYHWAFSIQEVYSSLSYIGPVVVGTDWMESMFDPDENGLLTVTGNASDVAGGHAYFIRSIILNEAYKASLIGSENNLVGVPLLRIRNQYGRGWGHEGEGLIWGTDMARLLKGIDSPGEARITTTAFKQAY